MNIPTLLDYMGAEKPVRKDDLEPCPTCEATGLLPMNGGAVKVCPMCHGSGVKG